MDWNSIIDALGGTGAVARALAQSESTISGWRARGIPAPHWAGVMALATAREVPDITLKLLAALAAHKLEMNDEAKV